MSLLQTKLRMDMPEGDQLMMKDPSAMLAELEGMVLSSKTPTFDLVSSMKGIFENQIMPGLQYTQYAAAQDTGDFLSVVDSCHNQLNVKRARSLKRRKWLSTLHAQTMQLAGRLRRFGQSQLD